MMLPAPRTNRSYLVCLEVVRLLQAGNRTVHVACSDPTVTATAICNLLPGALCEVTARGLRIWRPKYLELPHA